MASLCIYFVRLRHISPFPRLHESLTSLLSSFIYRYCDSVSGGDLSQHTDYNASERRSACKGANSFNSNTIPQVTKKSKVIVSKPNERPPPPSRNNGVSDGKENNIKKSTSVTGSAATTSSTSTRRVRPASTRPAHSNSSTHLVKDLQAEVTSLKLQVDSVERERDFYFAKLRDVEILGALETIIHQTT